MGTSEAVVEALGAIDDATLLSGGREALTEAAYRRLADISFDGIAIRAPGTADLSAHASLPILIAAEQDAARDRDVPLGANASVIVLRRDSGEIQAVPAFRPPPNKIPFPEGDPRSEPPPPRDDESSSGRGQGVEHLDLRAAPELSWRPGRYVIRVLDWDWASNAQPLTLTDGESADVPAGVPVAPEIDAGTPGSLPSYLRSERTPPLAGRGAALSLPSGRVEAGAPIPAHGTIRLEVEPGWPSTGSGKRQIPARLLLARRGVPLPRVIEIPVPVSPSGTEAEGYFSVDLRALSGGALEAGTYQVYLMAGETLSEPRELALAP